MLKKDELLSSTSCLNKAADDEPIFVLRAADPVAAATIKHWATMAQGHHEPQKIIEARRCANAFDDFYQKSRNVPVEA